MGEGIWSRANHPCLRMQQPPGHRVSPHSVHGPNHNPMPHDQPACMQPKLSLSWNLPQGCVGEETSSNHFLSVRIRGFTSLGSPYRSKCEIKLEGEEPWAFPGSADDLEIIHTPGHTYGHIVLLHKPSKCASSPSPFHGVRGCFICHHVWMHAR